MKKLAASLGVSGLGLMSAVGLVGACRSSLGLETVTVLFVSGVVLLVMGGSGYTTLRR